MIALRRLQRVGLVTRTSGPGLDSSMGDGDGYGGWKLGEGMRILVLLVMADVAVPGAEDGPACDAVSTMMP